MLKQVLLPFFFLTSVVILAQPDHSLFDRQLSRYVDEKGLVNYKDWQKDRASLKAYLKSLETNPPGDSWSKNEKLAYWINAYNAYTIDLILEHYPVESIKDIGSKIQIPFVNTPWDIKFIHIGEETYDLNNIEHGIIRKDFDEPRIHFALVCAAVSCPKLQNEAYVPSKLNAQLDAATREFLRDTAKNEFLSPEKAELSKIFSWYGGDFKKNSSLIEYINQYAPVILDKSASISYKDYSWNLNEQ